MLHSLWRARPAFIAAVLAVVLLGCSSVHADSSDNSIDVQLPPVLLQMIRDDAVQKELKLTVSQKSQTLAALGSVDPRWWLARQMQAGPLAIELASLTLMLRTELATFLTPAQQKRLAELERQAVGTRMVLRDDVAAELTITDAQRDTLVAAFKQTDASAAQLQSELAKGQLDATESQSKLDAVKAAERQSIVDVLSEAQKLGLAKLSGPAFDFSQVRRTYPLAPEMEDRGVTWIQGGPLKLEELRGKVVAVHFYAFQCINCQRNFPHYDGWHRDFADRGLVVIGIQTPETSAERDLKKVASAVASDGFEFPVVMDASSTNWAAWGNTMWPSVYLIDKQGFIRRWWQGEMNWQGTEGEQQMRETIEMLLKE